MGGLQRNGGTAQRRDGSDATGSDDYWGEGGGRTPRNTSQAAGGLVTMPVEELQTKPSEPKAESAFVNVLLEPYLW